LKTYLEYLKEISADDLLEGLLGYGLFAEKIPGFLTAEQFYKFYLDQKKPVFKQEGKDFIRYESMRNTNAPRELSIPNPFAYANLCNNLADQWSNIIKHFESNTRHETYKISRIHLRKLRGRKHLFEMNYKAFSLDGQPEQKIIVRNRFKVEADISSCFPSIYSHSISWSLVGKKNAKKTRHDKTKWYNILDFNLRNIKNGETNGLLIGPHVSNLISEVVLCVVDKNLWDKGYRFVRNIDDYSCYTSTMEDAEKFILDLASELKEFELRLNVKKTKISSLPISLITNWVNRLNKFPIGEKLAEDGKQIFEYKKLKGFMDLSIELMLEEKNSAILNYAIKVISGKYLGKNSINYYTNLIHHLVLIYPYLILSIEECLFDAFSTSKESKIEITKDIFNLGVEKRFYEACSYSLFWILKYNLDLKIPSMHDDALKSDDCIFLLLGYLVAEKDKNEIEIQKYQSKAEVLKKTEFDRYWLFIYECLPALKLEGDFRILKNNKVSFIKDAYIF
jgi:hypothetical protein